MSDDEVEALATREVVKTDQIDPDFGQFAYVPRGLEYDETPGAIFSMMEEMDFINKYRISRITLSRYK